MAVDLELSLFHDTPPKLAAQDYSSSKLFPLPSETRYSPASLSALFEAFMDDHLSGKDYITASSLHLLLHPLQCVSAHLHQCLATFGNVQDSGKELSSTFSLASKALIDELDTLLQRWHRLALSLTGESGICLSARGSFALYHIISLQNHASFPEVERIIRESTTSTLSRNLSPRSWMRMIGPKTTALLLFHCGQCLRHLRKLPSHARPLWWTEALYRVALTLSLAITSNVAQPDSSPQFRVNDDSVSFSQTHLIALDGEFGVGDVDQDAVLQRFLSRLQGTPVLTRSEGSPLYLFGATDVLDHCIDMLGEHMLFETTALANGVHVKLKALRWRWIEKTTM
jgi:hypothetical protein